MPLVQVGTGRVRGEKSVTTELGASGRFGEDGIGV